MRRLIRILGRVGIGLSLLLCLATVFLWVRSYWGPQGWHRSRYVEANKEMSSYAVGFERGRLEVHSWRLRFNAGVVTKVAVDDDGDTVILPGMGATWFKYQWVGLMSRVNRLSVEHWWERAGVFVRSTHNVNFGSIPGMGSDVLVIVPYWILFVVFLLWPGVWMWVWCSRSGFGEGRCGNCGYDLRGSTARCPECGKENLEFVSQSPLSTEHSTVDLMADRKRRAGR